jgi:predicted transcriptional regulator
LLDEIDSIAVELERPRDWVIQDALREYVSRHRLELDRWRETQEAINAAERGGVVPAEEVFAWLDTWGREGTAEK